MSDNGTDRGSGRGEISREERESLKARASDLGDRLDQVRARRMPPQLDSAARGSAFGQAFKIAIELVAGVLFGGLIGWVLDRQFGTAPWCLVLFLVLGFAAGMLNVVRTARRMQEAAEPLQRSAPPVAEDDEDR